MGFGRLTMHRLQDLVRLHRQGLRVRRIARSLGMGRNTVSRYLAALEAADLLAGDPHDLPDTAVLREAVDRHLPPKRAPQQRSSIERWLPIVDTKFDEGVGPTAIFDFLRQVHEDFDGSLSAVKRRCAALRRAIGVKPGDVTIRVETDPGDVAQVDFG